jgi:hypothetical protein
MVFVLDKRKKPLMPCTPKKARLLLARGRAVVHHRYPLVIRLKDRRLEESVVQPLVLKIDPGSKTSGMAVARVEATPRGEVHHAVHLAEIGHRGQQVHEAMATALCAPHTPQGVVAPIAALADRQCADLGTAVQAVVTPHPLGGGTGQI